MRTRRKLAEREVLEETGLRVRINHLLDVFTNPVQEGGASVFILYTADLLGGEMIAGDDAADVGFFGLGELPELAFASTHTAISRLSFNRDDDAL